MNTINTKQELRGLIKNGDLIVVTGHDYHRGTRSIEYSATIRDETNPNGIRRVKVKSLAVAAALLSGEIVFNSRCDIAYPSIDFKPRVIEEGAI
jgi:hypothetical protein